MEELVKNYNCRTSVAKYILTLVELKPLFPIKLNFIRLETVFLSLSFSIFPIFLACPVHIFNVTWPKVWGIFKWPQRKLVTSSDFWVASWRTKMVWMEEKHHSHHLTVSILDATVSSSCNLSFFLFAHFLSCSPFHSYNVQLVIRYSLDDVLFWKEKMKENKKIGSEENTLEWKGSTMLLLLIHELWKNWRKVQH